MRTAAASLLLLLACSPCEARRQIADYVIDLDKAPEDRYAGLVTMADFNATVWKFYDQYFANDKILTDALYGIADLRGEENAEQQGEIRGLAAASGLPVKFVQAIQMMYELQTLMVPVTNLTKRKMPLGYEVLERIPWRGPGCTGIIATNANDGVVYHARNLDFAPVPIMTNLVYNGIFKKGGVEIFRSQMIAGYTMAITGFRAGSNGYAIERNTRYTDHEGGNDEMIHNILSGRTLNGWSLRKILESESEFEGAVAAISANKYVSTEYAIVSGVKKGVILSMSPDGVDYTQTLGKKNFEERDDYIIMTNFDFFFHDLREWFDPTGGKMFAPRRIEAQKLLNASSAITPELLFETINHPGVLADTVFQAIISVEKGMWNISQPDL